MADKSLRARFGLSDSLNCGVGIKADATYEHRTHDGQPPASAAEHTRADWAGRSLESDTSCQNGNPGVEGTGTARIVCTPSLPDGRHQLLGATWQDGWARWAVVASASSIICSGLAVGFAYAMENGGPLRVVWLVGFVLSWLTLLAAIVVATVSAARVSILAARERAARGTGGSGQ